MKLDNKGYTLTELLFAAIVFLAIAFAGSVLFVVFHFIAKFW